MQTQVIEGTWEEVQEETARLAREHAGERVRLIVFPEPVTSEAPSEPARDPGHFYWRASPEEFARALDAIAVRDRKLPVLPPEAFERESLYEDRW